ncbi:MAG: TetR/AcrR family transcriptional regulator [Micromonosporaceae bacterium]
MPTRTWENLDPGRRERVLVAAMAEFGRHGYSGGSLNVIAREAGVAKGSLFQYFADKSDMYAHVAERAALRVYADLAELAVQPEGVPLPEHLVDALCAWVAYFASHPLERAITIATNLERDPSAREAIRVPINRIYVEAIGPMLMAARERGELRTGIDLDPVIATVVLLLQHLAMAPFTPGLDPILDLYGAAPSVVRDRITRWVSTFWSGVGAPGVSGVAAPNAVRDGHRDDTG